LNRALQNGAIVLLLLATAGSATASPTDPRHDHAAPGDAAGKQRDRDKMWQASLARAPLAMTAAFAPDGKLWLASVRDGRVYLAASTDKGGTIGVAVPVNAATELIAADGENRPKLAFGHRGEIYVSWTQSLEVPFAGHVRFARSLDGGRTFSAPVTVNTDPDAVSHRFESLGVNARGDIYLVWLDKRDAAARAGGKYTGLAVYYAVSTDRGAHFGANVKAADHACECCRLALAFDADAAPVIFWRHVFGTNTRDHALMRLDGKSALRRASGDGWNVDACPHHGPSLAIGPDGVYHLAWFTGAPAHAGLYYRRSSDRGATFTKPVAFGNPVAQAARPQVLSLGNRVFLAWKEFDGQASIVRTLHSGDGGRTWSAPATRATAAGASDHPLLIADKAAVYLSWHGVKEGWRLIEVTEGAS
jgi:hypothetical protein